MHRYLTLAFFFISLCAISARGQDYAITTELDTVYGEVKLLSYLNPQKIQVAEKANGSKIKKRVLSISQTKRFVMEGEIYEPVTGPEGTVFMQLRQEGYLSLYAYQPEGSLLYDAQILVTRDGSRLPVPNMNFRNVMRSFLSQCPDVVVKIEDKIYTSDDLPKIIDEYNECIRKHTEDRRRAIAYRDFYANKLAPWDTLQKHVERIQFEDRKDVLDMINEVRGKIKRSEPVPNFLITTLRDYLVATKLGNYLEAAIKSTEEK